MPESEVQIHFKSLRCFRGFKYILRKKEKDKVFNEFNEKIKQTPFINKNDLFEMIVSKHLKIKLYGVQYLK
jgi:hypothetical protein